jgi:hypothetical protein
MLSCRAYSDQLSKLTKGFTRSCRKSSSSCLGLPVAEQRVLIQSGRCSVCVLRCRSDQFLSCGALGCVHLLSGLGRPGRCISYAGSSSRWLAQPRARLSLVTHITIQSSCCYMLAGQQSHWKKLHYKSRQYNCASAAQSLLASK